MLKIFSSLIVAASLLFGLNSVAFAADADFVRVSKALLSNNHRAVATIIKNDGQSNTYIMSNPVQADNTSEPAGIRGIKVTRVAKIIDGVKVTMVKNSVVVIDTNMDGKADKVFPEQKLTDEHQKLYQEIIKKTAEELKKKII